MPKSRKNVFKPQDRPRRGRHHHPNLVVLSKPPSSWELGVDAFLARIDRLNYLDHYYQTMLNVRLNSLVCGFTGGFHINSPDVMSSSLANLSLGNPPVSLPEPGVVAAAAVPPTERHQAAVVPPGSMMPLVPPNFATHPPVAHNSQTAAAPLAGLAVGANPYFATQPTVYRTPAVADAGTLQVSAAAVPSVNRDV